MNMMDQKLLREREAKCIQDNPPGCTAACPVHVDVRGMVESLRKNNFAAGFTLFNTSVPFPRIIGRICEQPCQTACKRLEIDEAISINALEKFYVENHERPAAERRPVKARNKKVAVMGGGLSGLTVASELARKGYHVVIFESTACLGGSIWDTTEEQLPRQAIEDDLAPLKKNPFIEIRFHSTISKEPCSGPSFDSLCEDFDSVYVGIGWTAIATSNLGLETDAGGKIVIDATTLATSHSKVFAGGSLYLGVEGRSPITSISHGKIAANSIDRLLQNASLTANRQNEGPQGTSLFTSIEGVETQAAVRSSDPFKGYSSEEALREANRCLLCQCLECVKVCEYLANYGSYPKRYVREVYNNLSIVMGIHHANQMINSCSLCGLCEQVCPEGLNMGEICLEARQMMVKNGKMPPSAHDFALRDMAFSNSDAFILHKHQPDFDSSSMVFFPGCQLSASAPQHVRKMYEFLCERIDGGVGMMLGCCGAPADWAGQEDLFKETIQDVEQGWRDLGRPKVITGCPTCYAHFKHGFPQMEVETIWTLLERIGLPEAGKGVVPKKLAVQDACTTRHDVQLQTSIRHILHELGHEVQELENSRLTTECCGYGGLMVFANREVANKSIEKRIRESNDDYLAYCAMCRDNFVGKGKRVYHLLDLVFGSDDRADQKGPGFSERHENRARLKRSLLKDLWGETVDEPKCDIKLIIPEDVRNILEDRMILEEDIIQVIQYAEGSGNRFKNTDNDRYLACFKPVSVTYWVEYSPQGGCFVVHNAYCHRLEITG